jgi:hypothetical protein
MVPASSSEPSSPATPDHSTSRASTSHSQVASEAASMAMRRRSWLAESARVRSATLRSSSALSSFSSNSSATVSRRTRSSSAARVSTSTASTVSRSGRSSANRAMPRGTCRARKGTSSTPLGLNAASGPSDGNPASAHSFPTSSTGPCATCATTRGVVGRNLPSMVSPVRERWEEMTTIPPSTSSQSAQIGTSRMFPIHSSPLRTMASVSSSFERCSAMLPSTRLSPCAARRRAFSWVSARTRSSSSRVRSADIGWIGTTVRG